LQAKNQGLKERGAAFQKRKCGVAAVWRAKSAPSLPMSPIGDGDSPEGKELAGS